MQGVVLIAHGMRLAVLQLHQHAALLVSIHQVLVVVPSLMPFAAQAVNSHVALKDLHVI